MTVPPGADPLSGRSPTSARVLAAIVVGVTLIAGILVGIGLDRAFFIHHGRPNPGVRRFDPPFGMMGRAPNPAGRRAMRERFAHDLGLTADQQARIDTIMQHRMAAFDSIQQESRPRVRALIAATRAQIDSVLTPQQRDQYHALVRRRGRAFGPDSSARPPDRPPPPPN